MVSLNGTVIVQLEHIIVYMKLTQHEGIKTENRKNKGLKYSTLRLSLQEQKEVVSHFLQLFLLLVELPNL